MIIVAYDTETSGTDAEKNHILELGAVAFDMLKKRPVGFLNVLINHGIEIPEGITNINGLDNDIIERDGVEPEVAIKRFKTFLKRHQPERGLAHNAEFDKRFVKALIGQPLSFETVCSWKDLKYPNAKELPNKKLTTLANHFGVQNPFAHGAIADCLTTISVAINGNLYEHLGIELPKMCHVSIGKIGYHNNDRAKAIGFFYDGSTGHHLKKVKEEKVDETIASAKKAGFTVHGVQQCLL